MNQRIVQLIDDGLIQFRVGAFDGELDLLVQLDGEIVNQPAEPFEGVSSGSMRMLMEFSRSAAVSRSTASDTSRMSASSRRPATSLSRACTVTSSPTRLTS